MATVNRVSHNYADNRDGTERRVWPFFSTPFRTFAGVIGPIAGMMLLLAALPRVPLGLRVTAGGVVAVSLYAVYRGYGHRVEAGPEGVCYRRPGRALRLRWTEVRRIGRYIPLDRNRTSQYVYITRLETPPRDWREIDENTIQLQDRPELVETLQRQWRKFSTSAEQTCAADTISLSG